MLRQAYTEAMGDINFLDGDLMILTHNACNFKGCACEGSPCPLVILQRCSALLEMPHLAHSFSVVCP